MTTTLETSMKQTYINGLSSGAYQQTPNPADSAAPLATPPAGSAVRPTYNVQGALALMYIEAHPRTRWYFGFDGDSEGVYGLNNRRANPNNKCSDNRLTETYGFEIPDSLLRRMGFTRDQINSLTNVAATGGFKAAAKWIQSNM